MSTSGASLAESPLLQEDEAAAFLSISVRTLQSWRVRRSDGPPFIRYSGRAVRYRRSDLVAWVSARCFTSTSSQAEPPLSDDDINGGGR